MEIPNTPLFTPSRPSRSALGDISNHKLQASILKSVHRPVEESQEEIHGVAYTQIDLEVSNLCSISEILSSSYIPLSPVCSISCTPDYLSDSEIDLAPPLELDSDFSELQVLVDSYISSPVIIKDI
jgi:hypothetical protein